MLVNCERQDAAMKVPQADFMPQGHLGMEIFYFINKVSFTSIILYRVD